MPQDAFTHRHRKTWHKITAIVAKKHADPLAALLASVSEGGIEQREAPPDGPQAGREQIIGYLPGGQDPTALVSDLRSLLAELEKTHPGPAPGVILQEELIEEDWNQRWKEHFKPFRLTSRLVIKPSWEAYQGQATDLILEMDPGMAFGTGLHASTRLALLLIEEALDARPVASVLDVGTGTGILGMACALMGAKRVVGVDNDIDARAAAGENVVKNHLEARMVITPGELRQVQGDFELIIANITQDVLTILAPELTRRLAPKGRLVLSGLLAGGQEQAIATLYGDLGLTLTARKAQDEWAALLLAAPKA